MSSRFGRDPRSSLFAGYDASTAHGQSQSRNASNSPGPGRHRPNPYSYASPSSNASASATPVNAYPYANGGTNVDGNANKFRSATPNSRGQYSDAVLNELESQNDSQLEGMTAKVKMLKDITTAIGDEIRDSTALTEKMNDTFDNTRIRLRGTMTRMLRMAERTGVGWKIWVAFFAAIVLLFWYVRLT